MRSHLTEGPVVRTAAYGPRGARLTRTWLAVGLCALLAACQTGADPGGEASPSNDVAESPSVEPETTAPSEAAESPSVEPSAEGEVGDGPSPGSGTAVNGPNAITSPTPGETLSGPTVTVTGEGTAFEAVLSYRVVRTSTAEVIDESFTEAGANGEVGPFTIELELEPGDYTVFVWEADMSDGANELGPYLNLVEVSFTVE